MYINISLFYYKKLKKALKIKKNIDNGIRCDTIELFKRHLIKLINI